MKMKVLFFSICLSAFMISCNKDDDDTATPKGNLSGNEVADNSALNNISDDVTEIAESESNDADAGRFGGGNTFLGPCATVTTNASGDDVVRTIDFGNENCMLLSGNNVRGKIILTFHNDFDAATRTISYAFDNFYHNDRHVEGNRTVVKIISNGHPLATINIDMTVTTPNGDVYARTGTRIREFYAGYDTPFNFPDNKFSYTGSWRTTFPSGTVHNAAITEPVIVEWNCPHYLTSGSALITREGDQATALVDYGDGNCDNQGTIAFNSGAPIVFYF